MEYYRFNPGKKTSIVLISIFTIIAIIDSTIVKYITYSGNDFSISSNVSTFVIFSFCFAITGTIALLSIRRSTYKSAFKQTLDIRYFYAIATTTLITNISIIVIIIFQMILVNQYNVLLLSTITYVSHITTLFVLIFLIYIFLRWLKVRRNLMVMLYAVSFLLICINVVVSTIYLEYIFSRTLTLDRRAFPIHLFVIRQEVYPMTESLSSIFDILYLLSYFAMWTATGILLFQYRNKVGRIKYALLVTAPLIYLTFTYLDYFGNLFSTLIINSPVSFNVMYTIVFSATKQVGALLFSVTFFVASSLVPNMRVRKSLLISSIGMVMLFGSIEIETLQYRLYPPFGLITDSFMPLGAYLLFIGIFTSADGISRDGDLRREFHKSAMSQLGLIKSIGISEMEATLIRKFKSAEKYTSMSEMNDSSSYEEENVKDIIRDVLNEIYSKNKK